MAKASKSPANRSLGLPAPPKPPAPPEDLTWKAERRDWQPVGEGFQRGPWDVVAQGAEFPCRAAMGIKPPDGAGPVDLRLWHGRNIVLQITR